MPIIIERGAVMYNVLEHPAITRLRRHGLPTEERLGAVCQRCGAALDLDLDELCRDCKERIHSLVADFMDSLDAAERKYIDDATDGICISEWARRAV